MSQYKRKSDGKLFDARPVNVKKDGNGNALPSHDPNGFESVELEGGACDVPIGHMIVTPLGADGKPCGLPTAPSDAAFAANYDIVATAPAPTKPVTAPQTAKAPEGNS